MTDDSRARRHVFGSLFAVLVIGLAVVPTAPAGAGAATAPKISKASMKDADGDDRADRIQLTYDEPVNHVADSDGTYPFAVAGYQVKKVGAASARTLVVTIKEKTTPDIVAEPAITYTRTSRQPVRNAAGLQAANQNFTGTKRLDLDGDGFHRGRRRLRPEEREPSILGRPICPTRASSTPIATGSTARSTTQRSSP